MNIFVLTSSRADYGIYLPLLKKMKEDGAFNIKIIAFGTHVSTFHGYTIEKIKEDGFHIYAALETLILGDSPTAIANAMGNTMIKFSSLWERIYSEVDFVFALGDRYEMYAAASASIPFNIKIAHFHGGETTLGAVDNIFRHALTIMSSLHFTATQNYSEKVALLTGGNENIHTVGSISLEAINEFDFLSKTEFYDKYHIDMAIPSILVTFHPETVAFEKNEEHTQVLVDIFNHLSKDYQIVITMPNADVQGNMIRSYFIELANKNKQVKCVESFGKQGYFSCMKYCSFLLGNTSSGIIEAASFQKYVINIGDRQKDRAQSENVIDVAINYNEIIKAIDQISGKAYNGNNIYTQNGTCEKIIQTLKKYE